MNRWAWLVVVGASLGCRALLEGADELGAGVARQADEVPLRPAAGRVGGVADEADSPVRTVLAEVTKMAAEEALKAGLDAGVTPKPTDPDLTGEWRQVDDLGGGNAMVQTIRRNRVGDGLYTYTIDIRWNVGGIEALTVKLTGHEVIGANRQCHYATEVGYRFANAAVERELGALAAELTPDKLNADACSRLRTLTADRIEGTDDAGADPFVEERVGR